MTVRENILILMHNYATQFIDIANQYVSVFDKNKYKVTVAYLSGQSDEIAKHKTFSEEVVFFNFSKKNIRDLKMGAIQKLLTLCRKEKFTVVISHRYKPIYITLWASAIYRIPHVIFVMHAMKTMNSVVRRLFIALMARKNMFFAGVSNAVRDDLRHHIWRVPQHRIITLYNCIDMEKAESQLLSKQDARKQLALPDNVFIIGTVGRLAPEKDQKNMLYAFAKIKNQLPPTQLLFIGDGPLEQDLKQLAKQLNIEQDVIFAGFIADAQRYFKVFDIFMLTSTKEAFGRVLLEAMIAKVPVIGTRTNGIPEVIGDAGFIIDAHDSLQLSATLLTMANLTPSEQYALGDKGYHRVKANFSTDRFTKDFWQTLINAS